MRGNTFGEFLTLTSFGESHGPALGAVIDGCPAGIALSVDDFRIALRRRRPAQSAVASQRAEADEPELLSGIFNGQTLGTPIAVLVRNSDARSSDYRPDEYRAGHADSVWERKYGVRDYRGGGRASGRETLARVIGGVVAEKLLPVDLHIVAFTRQIGGIAAREIPDELTRARVDMHETRCPDPDAAEAMRVRILQCKVEGDSLGGIVELRVNGMSVGLGEPVFRKTKALLAGAVMSIGAVTAIEFGDAFNDTALTGSQYHGSADLHGFSERAAGIQGGITNGQRIIFRAAVKPVSTLGDKARSGRHDPCIVPRVIPVMEAMTALVLADLSLAHRLDTQQV